MQISKEQPMRPALDDVIDAVNGIGDIGPYVTDAVDDWLDEHPEATTTVQDDSLTTAKYQNGSVTTEKIADGAVTYDKLHEPDLLMVGGAESVTNDTAIRREYLFAPVPDGIGDGLALIESVKGNTVVQDGSLLPVRMEGVETVGFNQWDEVWELGWIGSDGANRNDSGHFRSTNYIPVFPNTEYYFKAATELRINYYDAAKQSIGQYDAAHKGNVGTSSTDRVRTTQANCAYIRFWTDGTTYKHDICINISDPARNGTYEPHWSSERTIPAATYFPQGMRSAGTVRDELRTDAAVTRVGERAYQSGDESNTSVITDGTVTHYALTTPTTTPIDPPLTLSYSVGADGTERVMVASGTQSAPPVFVTRYPVNLTDLAESIAPREYTIATGNHAIGDLIMLGWTLCKATQVIVTGETIEIGTNVTRTSVAAEIAALS